MTSRDIDDQLNTTKVVRYVIHSQIEEYERKGWKVVSRFEGSHHARYSVIMQRIDDGD